MLKCNDVHANENVKAMGYAVCKNQKYLRHVMLHDGLMPMHNAKQKKIEPLHRFFFKLLLIHHHMPADFAS